MNKIITFSFLDEKKLYKAQNNNKIPPNRCKLLRAEWTTTKEKPTKKKQTITYTF
jgi:ribosomal protein L4